MIKFMYSNFKNMPGIGNPIKAAYIGYLVKKVIKDGLKSGSASELGNLTGNELENELEDQANGLFNEFIMPEITANNIPAFVVAPAKRKAIKAFTGELRKQIESKVKEKVKEKV